MISDSIEESFLGCHDWDVAESIGRGWLAPSAILLS